jgi:hypothetical protein
MHLTLGKCRNNTAVVARVYRDKNHSLINEHILKLCISIGVHLNLSSRVGVEESIVNAPRISCLNLISLFALFVFL